MLALFFKKKRRLIIKYHTFVYWASPVAHGKESACNTVQCRRPGLDHCDPKIPQRRKWQPTPGILAWEILWAEVKRKCFQYFELNMRK